LNAFKFQASREESAEIGRFERLGDAEQFDVVLASDVLYEDVQVRHTARSITTQSRLQLLCGAISRSGGCARGWV
jgi:hypothetical protein